MMKIHTLPSAPPMMLQHRSSVNIYLLLATAPSILLYNKCYVLFVSYFTILFYFIISYSNFFYLSISAISQFSLREIKYPPIYQIL